MIGKIREHHSITVIGIFQIFLIVIGWLATCIHLKYMGYPDFADMDPLFQWSSLSLFVRSWVLILFLIPVGWMLQALWFEERSDYADSKILNVSTGLVVILTLFLILWISATQVGYRRILTLY